MNKQNISTKKIATIGFIALIGLFLFLTAIINLLWSGLGEDSSSSAILSFTSDEQEFKDYATLYIALLSFGASLFASLAIFLLFSHWREQKQYELEKQYAEIILNLANNIDIVINERYYSYIVLTEINEYVIYLNEAVNQSELDLTQQLYELSAHYKTLQQVSNIAIDDKYFRDYEDYVLLITTSINRVEEQYEKYYKKLPNENKSVDKKILKIPITSHPLTAEQVILSDILDKAYKNEFEIQINHSYGSIFTSYVNTHIKFKEKYQFKLKSFVDELVKKIKP